VPTEFVVQGVVVGSGSEKLIRCPGDPDLVYDLAADPRELRDLGGDPGAGAALRAEAGRRWDLAALDRAVRESQRERRVVVPALNRGRHTAWDYVPQSQAMRYIGTNADLYELQRRARLDTDDRRAS